MASRVREVRLRRYWCWLLMTLPCLTGCPGDSPPPTDTSHGRFGEFIGNVDVRWKVDQGEDRTMQLLKEFKYVDQSGREWVVPAGTTINGASIPRVFWSEHPPFVGDYRLASVVHDHFCNELLNRKRDDWEAIQKMFYEACRCGGLDEVDAKVFYHTVYVYWKLWSEDPGVFERFTNMQPLRTTSNFTGTEELIVTEQSARFQSDDVDPTAPKLFAPNVEPKERGKSSSARALPPELELLLQLKTANQEIRDQNPPLEDIPELSQKLVPISRPAASDSEE